ncbi:hypothetical protein TNCV_2407271, partial [Trichonephila clavipes]
GIEACLDLSPNQNALRIASGTKNRNSSVRGHDCIDSCPYLCSLDHCKQWRRWSTFNGRQRSGWRVNRPLCEGVVATVKPRHLSPHFYRELLSNDAC